LSKISCSKDWLTYFYRLREKCNLHSHQYFRIGKSSCYLPCATFILCIIMKNPVSNSVFGIFQKWVTYLALSQTFLFLSIRNVTGLLYFRFFFFIVILSEFFYLHLKTLRDGWLSKNIEYKNMIFFSSSDFISFIHRTNVLLNNNHANLH
jgi:hypothetical protein